MKDTLKNPGITKEEMKAVKEFAELKPDTKAAQKLLDFLESGAVKDAIKIGGLGRNEEPS